MTDQSHPTSEKYRMMADRWADLNAAAELLENLRSAWMSQRMQEHVLGGSSVAKAQMLVKASDEWRAYNEEMVEARRKANILRGRKDALRMRSGEEQSQEATARVEMRL